jgi:hypothetical protein
VGSVFPVCASYCAPRLTPDSCIQLTETDPSRSEISDANFLAHKDLQVTPIRLRRALLLCGCLVRILREDFASRCPDTVL